MTAAPRRRGLPVVAVVGRPNVGKSSLVNRIIGRREAIVAETPGVTRDRRGFTAEWAGRDFEIVDTGGLEPGQHGLERRIAEQAEVAIAAADAILLVVDAAAGIDQDDLAVAETLRRSGRPVLVAANKVDSGAEEPAASEFYRLGLGDPMPVSALHGRGSGDLLDALVKLLPDEADGRDGIDAWASIAIVGRPNVGKSSILNSLVRDDRSLVDVAAGTTRDPVDSVFSLPDGRLLRLVDTAGLRREVQIKDPIEYFSFLRARRTLHRVDAVLLVVDASEGATAHDQRIAQEIVAEGRACVVALNKWDLVAGEPTDRERLERDLAERLRFLAWARSMRISAITRRGIDRLPEALADAAESHRRRLPTATLNEIVGEAQEQQPHPRTGGRAVRILYAVMAHVAPPTVVVFATAPLQPSYLRFLENRIRAVEPYEGTPVRVEVRVRARRTR